MLCADPHIVRDFGCSVDQKSRVGDILLEVCPDTLARAIQSVILPKQEVIDFFEMICAAVHFLHSQVPPIIHCDVSASNVLLSRSGWKLSDFGSATAEIFAQFDDTRKVQALRSEIERCVAPALRPPEMLQLGQCRPIGPKADVWALGLLLFRLCTGMDRRPEGGVAPVWPSDVPIDEGLHRIAEMALAVDPGARPTAEQLLDTLFARFPQLLGPQWRELAPDEFANPAVGSRASPAKVPAKSVQPSVASLANPDTELRARLRGQRVQHEALDLADAAVQLAMIGDAGVDQDALFELIEGMVGPAGARRGRRTLSSENGGHSGRRSSHTLSAKKESEQCTHDRMCARSGQLDVGMVENRCYESGKMECPSYELATR
jgi:serine/threonine protein kinase